MKNTSILLDKNEQFARNSITTFNWLMHQDLHVHTKIAVIQHLKHLIPFKITISNRPIDLQQLLHLNKKIILLTMSCSECTQEN